MAQAITHTVLWIDDNVIGKLRSFLRTEGGINPIIKTCYKEGINFLENPQNRATIDAVILDVNCKYDENEKEPSAKINGKSGDKTPLKDLKSVIFLIIFHSRRDFLL